MGDIATLSSFEDINTTGLRENETESTVVKKYVQDNIEDTLSVSVSALSLRNSDIGADEFRNETVTFIKDKNLDNRDIGGTTSTTIPNRQNDKGYNYRDMNPVNKRPETKDAKSVNTENRSRSFIFPLQGIPYVANRPSKISFDEFTQIKHFTDGSNSNIFRVRYGGRDGPIVIVKMMKRDPNIKKIASKEFRLEHEVLIRLSHPNVVGYFGGGTSPDGLKFLVLERLNGKSLSKYLTDPNRPVNRSPFTVIRIFEIGTQLASALEFLHEGFHPEASIIHRDLKPDNIGFTEAGTLKLMDFGLCTCVRKRSRTDESYKMTGGTGSLRYMAPEVVRCLPYTELVDVYSLALVLWQVATGMNPFEGFKVSDFLPRVVYSKERPPIDRTGTEGSPFVLPGGLAQIIVSCWDDSPLQRLSSGEVHSELRNLLSKEPAGKSSFLACWRRPSPITGR